jgi:hypothetical protein
MFPTAEVRWFYRDHLPLEVEAWFHQGAGMAEQRPSREHHYLRLEDTYALGIKLRGGCIEIKQRVRRPGVFRFHERVTGIVEHWRKWSFQLAEPDGVLSSISVPATSWIAVRKERMLRGYRLTLDKNVVPVSSSEPTREGCELELSEVHVGEQDWWTLAFEAFGEEPILQEQLELVARHVFAATEPPSLNASQSRGYPDWLVKTARKEKTI